MSRSIRRAAYIIPLFLTFTALLCAAVWLLGGSPSGRARAVPYGGNAAEDAVSREAEAAVSADTASVPITCVVIDAGHGGEDGGTVSATGLCEKDVNLAVASYLRALFEAAGIPTVMTRTEDKLLYDRGVDYTGRKKALDLAARRIIAENTEGCLFISIHMNAFPQTQYSGMQVWYGMGDERSADVAKAIQTASTALMPANDRKIKAAGSNIYLLDRIRSPAVLVECGFLSNPAEASRLADEGYQRAVAAVIFGAVAAYVER